jgi:23S rRNA pseudouridine1911/1915/1917 synthase
MLCRSGKQGRLGERPSAAASQGGNRPSAAIGPGPSAVLKWTDAALIANKLAPIPVQPDKTGDRSLQDYLRAELLARDGEDAVAKDRAAGEFLEAAHRIDRRASGAVLFAKTHIALSTLEAAFRDRRIEKEYIACVEREPSPTAGKLEHRLAWDKRRNLVRTFRPDSVSGKPALLEYRVAGRSDNYFFVSVNLITGRHHQVRAQLSAFGCPIRGDLKYGARRSSPSGLIMLHARRIALAHPRTEARVEVIAPFPESEPLWSAYADSGEGVAAGT